MYFRDFWFSDSGTLTGLTMMEYVSALDGPFSRVVEGLEARYALSGEINFRVRDVDAVLRNVRERYSGGRVSELSGYGVWFEDWKFVVRPSDNEPLVRMTVEARTPETMAERRDELSALIRSS
jgi:phosphomannomutase